MFYIVKYRDFDAIQFIEDNRQVEVFTFTQNSLRVLGENSIKCCIKLNLRKLSLEKHLLECLRLLWSRAELS